MSPGGGYGSPRTLSHRCGTDLGRGAPTFILGLPNGIGDRLMVRLARVAPASGEALAVSSPDAPCVTATALYGLCSRWPRVLVSEDGSTRTASVHSMPFTYKSILIGAAERCEAVDKAPYDSLHLGSAQDLSLGLLVRFG